LSHIAVAVIGFGIGGHNAPPPATVPCDTYVIRETPGA
jgi:hypothetical protein